MIVLFISTAFADSAAGSPSQFMQFIPIVAIFVVFYFFMIRPQSKKAQEHKDFLASLKPGTMVVTNSGIIGKIREIKNEEVMLDLSSGISIYILKPFISSLYSGGAKISSIALVKKTTKSSSVWKDSDIKDDAVNEEKPSK
jgi:preprotein translocase subunit YajC